MHFLDDHEVAVCCYCMYLVVVYRLYTLPNNRTQQVHCPTNVRNVASTVSGEEQMYDLFR